MYTLIVSRLAGDVFYTYMVVWSCVMRLVWWVWHGIWVYVWDMLTCVCSLLE